MKIFNEDEFHDCLLDDIDFSNWRESVAISLILTDTEGIPSQKCKLIFKRVLSFGFEAGTIGEFGDSKPLLSIYNEQNTKELKLWKERIGELAEINDEYPLGIKSAKYSDLYHFIIYSPWFQGLAFLPLQDGFQVICRDYSIEFL